MKRTYYLFLSFLIFSYLGKAETKSLKLGNDLICTEVCYDNETGSAFLKSISSPQSGSTWKIAENQPLFVLYFSDRSISSIEGWKNISVKKGKNNATLSFERDENFSVEVCMDWNKEMHVRWGKCTLPANAEFTSSVLFPLALRQLPFGTKSFYPYSSGIVYEPDTDRVQSQGNYPAGFGCSMPWFAVWDKGNRGLYYAAHDKKATMKTLKFNIKEEHSADMEILYPTSQPDGSEPIITPCDIVLRSFAGDWFDAAQIYKKWMKTESYWYAQIKTNKNGRCDTPEWMKELCVWVLGSDKDVEVFRREIGVPVGFHWYNWHEIPFDNDYPHYIPAREHFTEKVRHLQNLGIYIMPYINGRLWDTHDHGLNDSLFTAYAFPAASKTRKGDPNIEDYGSKESDGSNVKLAVMCPSTDIWRNKMKEVVLKLLSPVEEGGYGVDGVYMDQIAAAPPVSCWDKLHNHKKGGGDWWVPAYTALLTNIRREMPKGKILTTESDADGYTGVMDGFLTWQHQDNKQVPAFAAVYGGMIQLFGRNYTTTQETPRDTRFKLMQSFVFGEQLGWISASIVNDKDRFPILRDLAQLRYKFRTYFSKGEMVHAPTLYGENPTCKFNWYFHYLRDIETPSVMCSAWRMLDGRSAIIILANCSEEARDLKMILPTDVTSLARKGMVCYRNDGSSERLSALPETMSVPAGSTMVLELGKK